MMCIGCGIASNIYVCTSTFGNTMLCRPSTESLIAIPSMAALQYGPIIRTLSPGEAFGELALLQPQCLRTATVIAKSCNQDGDSPDLKDGLSLLNSHPLGRDDPAPLGGDKVTLIKVTRQLFDEAVTSLQVTQLESRISFLMNFKV
jgi:hypothetical protein